MGRFRAARGGSALQIVTVLCRSCSRFIIQLRQKIGVSFGPSEVTTGGNALKFYASLRLDVRRVGAIKKDEVDIGAKARVKVVKNKLAPPFRQVEMEILFNRGISVTGDILDLAEARGLIQKSGNWISFGDERLGNGREKARENLEANPETAARLLGLIHAHDAREVATA